MRIAWVGVPKMKITAISSAPVLQELAAWCQLAHDVLSSSQQPREKAVVRTVKRQLMRQHARHLAQIREWLRRRRAGGRSAPLRREAWSEVIEAMRSHDEYVAIAACALLERAVLAAYERAADHLWLDETAMRLVRRQRLVLKCCHARHLRRPTGNATRDRTIRPVERSPAFGTMLAVAAAS